MKTFILFVILLAILAVNCENIDQNSSNPLITLSLGKIEGTLDSSLNGRTFYAFQGVPYALPPIGEHRFQVTIRYFTY